MQPRSCSPSSGRYDAALPPPSPKHRSRLSPHRATAASATDLTSHAPSLLLPLSRHCQTCQMDFDHYRRLTSLRQSAELVGFDFSDLDEPLRRAALARVPARRILDMTKAGRMGVPESLKGFGIRLPRGSFTDADIERQLAFFQVACVSRGVVWLGCVCRAGVAACGRW